MFDFGTNGKYFPISDKFLCSGIKYMNQWVMCNMHDSQMIHWSLAQTFAFKELHLCRAYNFITSALVIENLHEIHNPSRNLRP